MIDFRQNIIFLIAKAHQQAQSLLKSRLKAFGLTPVQCLVLEALWDEEGLSVGEIGRRLVLDTATLAGVLDRMVTAGWIRREIDASDGRVARIYQTEKAKGIAIDLSETIDQVNGELFEGFSLEEKLLYKRFLRDTSDR